MPVGFTSVLVDGVAPGNDHMNEVALTERLLKFVQVPGQIWLGAVNNAEMVEPAHGGIAGDNSAMVYMRTWSRTASVQL